MNVLNGNNRSVDHSFAVWSYEQLANIAAAGLQAHHTDVKVRVHTLDIAPLRSESPPQKRSGMGRVLEGFHSFTCTPTRSSAIAMGHIPGVAGPKKYASLHLV